MQGPSTSVGAGKTQYSGKCPDGYVMTGIQVGVKDGKLSGYANIRCKPPKNIDAPGSGQQVSIANSSPASGTNVSFDCPVGFAVNQLRPQAGKEYLEGVQIGCARFADNAAPMTGPILGRSATMSSWTAPTRNFITGVAGNAGSSRLNSVAPIYADFTKSVAQVYTAQGIADGCMGIGDSASWKYEPGSGNCDSYMVRTFCQQHPSDPRCSCILSEMTCPNKFDNNCIRSNGYRTNDMKTVTCPDIMNCVQYNRLSPGAKAVATNYQQNCSTSTTIDGNTTTNTTTNSSGGGSTWIWVMVVVLVFMAIVVVGLVASGVIGGSSSGNQVPGPDALSQKRKPGM